jgi:hypothetical protein
MRESVQSSFTVRKKLLPLIAVFVYCGGVFAEN